MWMHRESLASCSRYKQSFVTSTARDSICPTRDSDYVTLSPIRIVTSRMRENVLVVTRGARYHLPLCTDEWISETILHAISSHEAFSNAIESNVRETRTIKVWNDGDAMNPIKILRKHEVVHFISREDEVVCKECCVIKIIWAYDR